jgi:glycosyltransferase involved in cell wall biosynthesis
MKILHINRSDIEGGAARAAMRLLNGICQQGFDGSLYVQRKSGDDPQVLGSNSTFSRLSGPARRLIEAVSTGRSLGKMKGLFSPAFLPDRLFPRVSSLSPDIVHLHWVARMMRLETLSRFKVPIVWTLHDSWPFTGGCFLPAGCTRYRETCGRCPALGSSREEDLSRRVWQRKRDAWKDLNMTIVAPSRWMAERAKASSLFRDARIEIIPNGLDTRIFQPTDKSTARESLSLPQEKKLILFGAKSAIKDRNKGFHLLAQALRHLAECGWRDEAELVVFGSSQPDPPPDLGIEAHFLGWQSEDATLALLYAAADVFVLPSIQENLPYAVMEAMACGTPCVAFRQGGVVDLIDHEQDGYLATPFDAGDLANGITYRLNGQNCRRKMAEEARRKIIKKFSMNLISNHHIRLYKDLIKQ